MELHEIDVELARLNALRADAVRARDVARNEAWSAFVMDYDYHVEWVHPAQFRVTRTVTPECAARLAAFKDEWGTAREPFVGGMTYSVLVDADGNNYVEGGGGSVIIDLGNDCHSSFDPEPINADILAALRAGSVPISIRRS